MVLVIVVVSFNAHGIAAAAAAVVEVHVVYMFDEKKKRKGKSIYLAWVRIHALVLLSEYNLLFCLLKYKQQQWTIFIRRKQR